METTVQKTNSEPRKFGPGARGASRGPRSDRPSRPSFDRPKPEFDQKMVSIRRVTRVVSGGRRFSFAVAIAIGDKKGSIGVGTGKAGDTALAIQKALKNAKKSMIKIKVTKDMSIPHEVSAKFASSKVHFMPNRGKGIVAGSALRDIINLAGLKNVTGKIHSPSKNKLNNARATMEAFAQIATPRVARVTSEEALPEKKAE